MLTPMLREAVTLQICVAGPVEKQRTRPFSRVRHHKGAEKRVEDARTAEVSDRLRPLRRVFCMLVEFSLACAEQGTEQTSNHYRTND